MMRPEQQKTTATQEAAYWLVALEDAPEDAALRQRFDTWLNEAPENADAWMKTSGIYDQMAQIPPVHAHLWRRFRFPPQMARGAGHRRITATAAALAACLLVLFLPEMRLHFIADHMTATSEQRLLVLDDGSRVHLAPESAMEVTYNPETRQVALLEGEAFFEVTPDADRPFQVLAGGVETTVLGTAFDVHLSDGATTVAVHHGNVRVDRVGDRSSSSRHLGAGQWIRLTEAGEMGEGHMLAEDVAAWTDGQLVVRDRPIAAVVDDLRRYHNGAIFVTDGRLARLPVTGVYDPSDPEAALKALVEPHGGKVVRLSPWVLILSAN